MNRRECIAIAIAGVILALTLAGAVSQFARANNLASELVATKRALSEREYTLMNVNNVVSLFSDSEIKERAKYATGPCGSATIVYLGYKRIAVAGQIMSERDTLGRLSAGMPGKGGGFAVSILGADGQWRRIMHRPSQPNC